MKMILNSVALAGLMFGATSQPALAQAATPIVQGLAIANLEAVVANANAFRTAQQQRPTTYKAQLDAAEARRQQLNSQIRPLAEKFERDRQAANPNQAALQQQMQSIQRIQESGQQELQRILQPVALSEAYVEEQINERLTTAVQNAMNKRKITLLLSPSDVISANNAYNLNQAILAELNTLVPSVQLVPPQGWEPRQVREARAAQQQGQQGAAPQAPAVQAGPQPQGR